MNTNQTRQAIKRAKNELGAAYPERSDFIEAIFLALLTKEHVFVLGPPGTAKSALASTVGRRVLQGVEYFEVLLNSYTSDQSVLGPVNIKSLRDEGVLRRNIKGYLPTAHIAMLDEIGRLPPGAGAPLLSILNERKVHEVHGDQSWIDAPLWTAICASNSALTPEEIQALYDRLLLRVVVQPIQDPDTLEGLLMSGGEGGPLTQIDIADFEAAQAAVQEVELTSEMAGVVVAFKEELAKHGITASDRRWVKSIAVLKANAWLEGRTEVSSEDMPCLAHVMWSTEDQRALVRTASRSAVHPLMRELVELEDSLNKALLEHGKSSKANDANTSSAARGTKFGETISKIGASLSAAEQLLNKFVAAGHDPTSVNNLIDTIKQKQGELISAFTQDGAR